MRSRHLLASPVFATPWLVVVACGAPAPPAGAPGVPPTSAARAAEAAPHASAGADAASSASASATSTAPVASSTAPAGRKKTPTLRQGATQVNGRLPPEVIQRVVRRQFGRFRVCYEDALKTNPSLEGRVTATFVIDRSGAVTKAIDGGSNLSAPAAVSCVIREFSSLVFPQPESGDVTVVFPIVFSLTDAPPSETAASDATRGDLIVGEGGLGLSGVKPGGEGIGLGTLGTLGRGAGQGDGSGAGKRSSPLLRQGASEINGRLMPEVVHHVLRQNMGRFRLCYESGLQLNPKLQGRITTKFVIDETGAVGKVADGGSDLPDSNVVACVLRGVQNLSFPKPERGVVTVVYPVIFSPGEPPSQ